MADYLKLIEEKKAEEVELIKRWDADRDLYYLKPYTMMTADGLNKIRNVVNVTLAIPARFANDVTSLLGTAKEQVIVETEDKKIDTRFIEDFRRAALSSANARLELQGKDKLNPWWDFHGCLRGICAASCLFQMFEEVLVPEINTWDRRFVTYDVGVKGLSWAANETVKTKSAVEAEEWFKNPLRVKHINVLDKNNALTNVFDTEHMEIWLNKAKVLEQEHSFGFTPVVIRSAAQGSMLADDDSLSHKGEGIFFLIRGGIAELNRLITIMETLNLISIKPPKGWASEGGKQESPEYDEAMSMASITAHEIAGGVTDIKFGDAQRSAQLAYSILREEIERATAAASDLGTIESPPASGVRAMVAGESRDQLLSPRLGLKAAMNKGLADMLTAQVIQIGGSVELGTPGHKRLFETSKLQGEYEGYFKYTIRSSTLDASRASMAAAYGNLIPDKAKRVEVLQREDPDGDERQLRVEEMESIVPPIKMDRGVRALLEMAEKGDENAEREAEIASSYMGMTLKQMMAGGIAPPKTQPEQEPKQVLPLYGGATGGRQRKAPTEEEE